MINIFIGVLITVAFFSCLAVAYYMGRRQRKVDIVEKLSQEEELEQQRRLKGFDNVLNYDYDVAIGKRVNKNE